MKPIFKHLILQACWLPLLIALLIAGDYYLEMVQYQRLERSGIDAGIESLQQKVKKQDSVLNIQKMQIEQLFMQDNGIKVYQLPISDTQNLYISNTGYFTF